jgi:integrase
MGIIMWFAARYPLRIWVVMHFLVVDYDRIVAWAVLPARSADEVSRELMHDDTAATITITGKVVRVTGKGLVRVAETKSAAGRRTLVLPRFAVDMLRARRRLPYLGEQTVIFPSTAATLRDPDNFNRQWRQVRSELGAAGVTSDGFRKTVATLIDDDGLSARIGADHLGHAQVSMTQNVYMTRGRVHPQVAELMERVINDE